MGMLTLHLDNLKERTLITKQRPFLRLLESLRVAVSEDPRMIGRIPSTKVVFRFVDSCD